MSPGSGHSIVHKNASPQSLVIDSPSLSELVNSVQEDAGFDCSSDVNIPHTTDQGLKYESGEDDECS
ncbi:hypothetical protein J3459_008182 [Metarhizium acridum]|uniref:uncharacterized protein n=1 Tax=Metarhizium acridum TaxID=92637 RepID=UPI001C6AF88F|nr:hypothetical protein J3458_000729 [Metarhizium acridum]KAG8426372.1 hypothetical protein J3459_008182 [Metarhizium acridum]